MLAPPLAWFVNAYIQDPWLCKKFAPMLARSGLEPGPLQLLVKSVALGKMTHQQPILTLLQTLEL